MIEVDDLKRIANALEQIVELLRGQPDLPLTRPGVIPAPTPVRSRAKKPIVVPASVHEAEDPFPTRAAAKAEIAKPSPEDFAEAKRRGMEVMGAFVRKYKDATPTGRQRLGALLTEICGREITNIEMLTYEENVKLIPRFERELDATPAV